MKNAFLALLFLFCLVFWVGRGAVESFYACRD